MSGTETGLAAFWDMNAKLDQTLTDRTGNVDGILGASALAEVADPQWTNNKSCQIYKGGRVALAARTSQWVPYDSIHIPKTSYIRTFPSPVAGDVKVYIKSDTNEPLSLTITDLSGNEMLNTSQYSTNELITIPNRWKTGMYIVRAQHGDKVEETKIVKLE